MANTDFQQLTEAQLDELRDAAIRRVDAAQQAYETQNRNVSEKPDSPMPVIPMGRLEALDREYESAQAELDAIDDEIARRRRGPVEP